MSAILVCGAGGMLGRAWLELLAERGLPARPARFPELDLRSEASIREHVRGDIRAVINCAAYTDVDGAERDEAAATEVNGAGVGRLVARCDALGARLVHYSTDYVFDGRADAPYRTDHPRAPINAYGRSKRVGEDHVLSSSGAHLLIRTSWLYAPWGENFVRTIARLAAEREELRVVDDQRGRPTSAEHLARLSLSLLEREERGVFHGADGGSPCTWFDLAAATARGVGATSRVLPCSSDEHARAAARPAFGVLDLSRTEAALGPLPGWADNLAAVLSRLPRGDTSGR